MDGFSKFKRDMFKFDRSDYSKLLSLKIDFRFGRETVVCSFPENQKTDFRNSNGICSHLIEVMIEKCCRWKSTSGLDGKKLFAHILRTNRRIFEIQTAYVQVWLKWLWENVVAENLLPVSTGKGFLLISQELIDGFSKFKRHMLRLDRRCDMTFLILEIYFRCEQKIENGR